VPGDRILASRQLYWRDFALWRRSINGFNQSPSPPDLEEDLNGAIADFNDSLIHHPAFVESKIGEASCFGYLAYLSTKDPARIEDMIQHSSSFLKDAMASDPDNPRLLWVLGPIRWSSPPERGGGQDKAFDLYQRGLEAVRTRPALSDPLEPCWGEPELLMNRAWSNLHRTTPDRKAAQNDAAAALTLVPYWLYVRATFFCRKFKMRRPRRADCPGRPPRVPLFIRGVVRKTSGDFDSDRHFDLHAISANRCPALE
jgi:hypothetical protein